MDGHVPDGGLWLVSGLLRDDVSLWSACLVPFTQNLAGRCRRQLKSEQFRQLKSEHFD